MQNFEAKRSVKYSCMILGDILFIKFTKILNSFILNVIDSTLILG